MKVRLLFTAFTLLIFSITINAQEIFVDQDWLQSHSGDDNLVLLHVANPKSYEEGHIAGAQTINPMEFASVVGDLYWEIPEVSKMDSTLRSKGIDDNSQIVLYYGGDDHAATFRLYFTLDYFGLAKRTRILDGGLKGWQVNNLALETTTPTVNWSAPESLTLKPNKKLKVDKDFVRKTVKKKKINVIDARRPAFYTGEQQGEYKRGGHIAGAGNITWLDIVDENMFVKDKDTLEAMYLGQGVNKGEKVVSYCHVGLRASTIYTIAKYLGFDAKLYDGSFNEWHALSDEYGVEK